MGAEFNSAKATRTTFEAAQRQSDEQQRHLLIGNGFSIGAHPSFGCESLHREAVRDDPSLANLFSPGDTNFENALQTCASEDEAARLRAGLIRAVAAVHPEHSLRLTEAQCLSCRDFLEHFVGRARSPLGSLFTTNYDLLLHWVLSRQGKNPGTKQRSQLRCWDGFQANGVWNPDGGAQAWYLHGAVHVYQVPWPGLKDKHYTRMLRYEWGRPLKKQVEACLNAGQFPVFVAAGSSGEKVKIQRQWEYLRRARQRFRNVCKDPRGVLFTVGHSFGPSDSHIAGYIGAGQIGHVFLGAFSGSDEAKAHELAEVWAEARRSSGQPPVSVSWFDVRECQIWDRRVAASSVTF